MEQGPTGSALVPSLPPSPLPLPGAIACTPLWMSSMGIMICLCHPAVELSASAQRPIGLGLQFVYLRETREQYNIFSRCQRLVNLRVKVIISSLPSPLFLVLLLRELLQCSSFGNFFSQCGGGICYSKSKPSEPCFDVMLRKLACHRGLSLSYL